MLIRYFNHALTHLRIIRMKTFLKVILFFFFFWGGGHILRGLQIFELWYIMLLLTNCEVHTGKYLYRSFEVRTERSEVRTKS